MSLNPKGQAKMIRDAVLEALIINELAKNGVTRGSQVSEFLLAIEEAKRLVESAKHQEIASWGER
ncbi:hypothetical protein ACQR3W_21950 [Rhodococcus ruber]|uniref:Uncharacterized protein n=1 Tax=Rhodococcus ruber TaxID=1830 RepID=A0A098BJU6_9NOCA|nr:hypothetical protein [Rhodococcus ruber]MCZ4505913.1 hypothetical protein [Rhodococcus ruber]MCZ4533455.1 hypothetical protein [Rhodococcus ruber]CDZ89029.1 hypothetical protein RHRU231_450196 [Rhodococcus ruber]